jgi:hypothetical protein
MSQSSWLVAGVLPGIESQRRKKLEPDQKRPGADRTRPAHHPWRRCGWHEQARPSEDIASANFGAGAVAAVQLDLFCSVSHSMEPMAHSVWAGCGFRLSSSASARRRVASYIPQLAMRILKQSRNRAVESTWSSCLPSGRRSSRLHIAPGFTRIDAGRRPRRTVGGPDSRIVGTPGPPIGATACAKKLPGLAFLPATRWWNRQSRFRSAPIGFLRIASTACRIS